MVQNSCSISSQIISDVGARNGYKDPWNKTRVTGCVGSTGLGSVEGHCAGG